MSLIKKYKIEIIIFFVALILRLVVFSIAAHNLNYNYERFAADGYYDIAVNLIEHHVYTIYWTDPPSLPDSIRPPGLPIVILPFLYFFKSAFGFIILQIVIGSLIPIIGRRLALAVNLPASFANLIGFFMAIDVLGISLSMQILTETFFTYFLLLAIFYQVKLLRKISLNKFFFVDNKPYSLVILSGFLFSLATLVRPTSIYIPFFIAIAWIIYGYKAKIKNIFKFIIIFLLASYVILLPWFYRNYKVFKVVGYSSVAEKVLFADLGSSITALKNHQSYGQAEKEFLLSQGLNSYPDVPLNKAAWFKKRALRVIYENPVYFLESAAISLYTFFTHDGALNLLSQLNLDKGYLNFPHGISFFKQSFCGLAFSLIGLAGSPLALVLLFRLFWILTAFCFVLSLGYQVVRHKLNIYSSFFLLLVLFFAFTTIANGLAGNARFRYPVDTLILIFVFQGFVAWLNERKSKKLLVG